jgi:hypothetical protein
MDEKQFNDLMELQAIIEAQAAEIKRLKTEVNILLKALRGPDHEDDPSH